MCGIIIDMKKLKMKSKPNKPKKTKIYTPSELYDQMNDAQKQEIVEKWIQEQHDKKAKKLESFLKENRLK